MDYVTCFHRGPIGCFTSNQFQGVLRSALSEDSNEEITLQGSRDKEQASSADDDAELGDFDFELFNQAQLQSRDISFNRKVSQTIPGLLDIGSPPPEVVTEVNSRLDEKVENSEDNTGQY